MIRLSKGNRKLVNTDKVRFLIWNLPAVETCPYSTEMCRKYCYARKAERLYKAVLPARLHNLEESYMPDFVQNMVTSLKKEISGRAYVGKKILFRIHEAGDFYNRDYVKKWIEIARFYPNIQFLAYTKSVQFFVGLEIPENMTIRFSVWNDTNPQDLEIARSLKFPIYTAIDKEGYQHIPVKNRCNCAIGCGDCGKCWSRNIDLTTEIH